MSVALSVSHLLSGPSRGTFSRRCSQSYPETQQHTAHCVCVFAAVLPADSPHCFLPHSSPDKCFCQQVRLAVLQNRFILQLQSCLGFCCFYELNTAVRRQRVLQPMDDLNAFAARKPAGGSRSHYMAGCRAPVHRALWSDHSRERTEKMHILQQTTADYSRPQQTTADHSRPQPAQSTEHRARQVRRARQVGRLDQSSGRKSTCAREQQCG